MTVAKSSWTSSATGANTPEKPVASRRATANAACGNVRRSQITVSGLDIEIQFKAINHLHLAVYPPDGRVRVAAPTNLDEEAVRLAVVKRLPWIKRQRDELRGAERLAAREMVSGESHYLWGRRYRLHVIETEDRPGARVQGDRLVLAVKLGTTAEQLAAMLARWERRQLRARIPSLLDKWLPVIGAEIAGWGTRRMKTKWGSYSSLTRRVWLNTELAKKPPRCLEYIVVHELVHTIERGHGDAFVALMDKHLPDWRSHHHELNAAPLTAEHWPDREGASRALPGARQGGDVRTAPAH